jgi:hypothetical protein
MAVGRLDDFNLGALYLAIDAQRQSRGITWQQAMLEINRQSNGKAGRHPIARSTVLGLRTKAIAEGDGVLQMLRWLNRSPESFVPGCKALDVHTLPYVPFDQVLRFDTVKLHAAIDTQRTARRLTWEQVAQEIGGMSATTLTHMKKGGRTGFPFVMRITRWLGEPAAHFTRITAR